MAKMSLRASAYRVAKGKAEIAREEKWQKTAKLATKKRRDLENRKPAEKGNEGSEGRDRNITTGAEEPKPEAPDKNKGR